MSEAANNTASPERAYPATMAEYWRDVGPKLKAIERQELRNYDFRRHQAVIDALLEIGIAHAQPRTTSGLVELHRRLRKLYS